ncbi:MAG: PP2C family protein-serine/threonine phosphatase [Rhodothermales bacterium]
MNRSKVTFFTFLAVFGAIFLIGAVVAPFALQYAEGIYLEVQSEVNERHASAMANFVRNRLKAGVDPEEVIKEFQEATAGTELDNGYVCLINQEGVLYLSHPLPEFTGMPVKPMALFDPGFTGEGQSVWREHLARGESNSGLLHIGENMPVEVVHFDALKDINWTISSHENTAQIQSQVKRVRSTLTIASVLFGLLIGIPATLAARRVNGHYEQQQQRQFELEQQLLKTEHDRKEKELQEARALQLSMLPASAPELSTADVAFYMNPATEVGGDYYDYHVSDEGNITIAIGDATGHGLQANTLVTATKSLFASLGADADLVEIMAKSSQTLKRIGLPKLYMAFALARITKKTLEVVGAGMPAALLYRAATNEVESIPLKGMPLGGFANFSYQKSTHKLASGDTLLLMSDGFPEQFDANRAMRGYDFAKDLLFKICPTSPDSIISTFTSSLNDWRAGEPQTDDVTFVVYQVK